MIKIQLLLALSFSLTAILVALSPLSAVASGTDDSIQPISPRIDRPGADDSIKPIAPRFQRSGTNDDGIKPVFPKLQRLSPSEEILKPVAPKQPLPAKKTKTGQPDESI